MCVEEEQKRSLGTGGGDVILVRLQLLHLAALNSSHSAINRRSLCSLYRRDIYLSLVPPLIKVEKNQ